MNRLQPRIPIASAFGDVNFERERKGQNRKSLLVRKRQKSDRGKARIGRSFSVLDRCGNNWKNGKGGCGILIMEEVSQCLATMFQPIVLVLEKTGDKNG